MMSSRVFVDSSAFKAYYDQDDEFHERARAWMGALGSKGSKTRGLVTTDYVLDETITLIMLAHSHGKAVEFADASLASRILAIEYVGKEGFAEALELFKQSRDKAWSLTDCASFVTMRGLGMHQAFAFDPHFNQAGFDTVP